MSNLLTKLIVEPGTGVKLGDIDPGHRSFRSHDAASLEIQPRVQRTDGLHVVSHHEAFIVEPGTRVNLSAIDPSDCGRYESYEEALPEIQDLVRKLDQLQYRMYAEEKHSLLIVLQGLDACGKDGTIRHLLTGMNPAGCRIVGFKRPKPEELDHDFLWRVHPHLPAKGEVSIFNRSHYEDVLVVRVHQLVPVEMWSKRYDLINDFERLLVMENNTTVLKFFLYISKEEQLVRFKQRLDDPTRRWKISKADYEERTHWNHYIDAFEDMLQKTSTRHAPWFVIPSNHKWFRDMTVSQIVTRTLDGLGMRFPEPKVDLENIRRRYHAAEDSAKTPECEASSILGGRQ
jgi:PPK2 family polyphosphate:nucleotide phosphotransferase